MSVDERRSSAIAAADARVTELERARDDLVETLMYVYESVEMPADTERQIISAIKSASGHPGSQFARELLETSYVFVSRFVDTAAALVDGFDVHAWCQAVEELGLVSPPGEAADSDPRSDA